MQPLLVTGVSPQGGAVEVEPDVAVSVAFNKAIAAGQDLGPLFTVKASGVPLPGGYFIAPGQQTVVFMASGPLPVGARIQVTVSQVQAAVGPGQGPAFTSDFTVRPPLTIVRGLVMDERFQPLKGVKVTLEGQSLSTETGVDGNWALFGSRGGPAVARFDGVTSPEGLSYPTVRRRLYVTAPGDTQDTPLILYPTDTTSAQPVDATSALHLTFGGREKDPVIDIPANGLAFADGTTHGFLTATLIPRYALPVKIEGHASPAALWQLAPAGTWLSKPVTLSLPNRTNLPPGRLALILAYDNSTQVMKRVAFGRVSPDGSVIATEEPLSVPSLEFFGYMPLTEAQSTAVASAMGMPVPGGSTSTDGGLGLRQPAPRRSMPAPSPWRWVIWALGISEAHAQSLLGMFGIGLGTVDSMVAAMEPAMVQGTVRAPRGNETFLTVLSPDLSAAPMALSTPSYSLPVTFSVRYESNQPTSIGAAPSALVSAVMTARGPAGLALGPPADGAWTQQGGGQAQVSSVVGLAEGTTRIFLSGTSTYDSTSVELSAKLTRAPADGGPASYALSVTKVADSSEGADPLANLVRFSGAEVEVTGATDQLAITNAAGHYGTAIKVPPGDGIAISCTSLPTGPRAFTRVDALGVAHFEQAPYNFGACSVTYSLSAGFTSKADILVDARFLHGSLKFAGRDGRPLPPICDVDAGTARDESTGEVQSISAIDVSTTEVHFFREDNLEIPIAHFAIGSYDTGTCGSGDGHGNYARIRLGPTTNSHRAARNRCLLIDASGGVTSDDDNFFYESECRNNRSGNFVRLNAGDRLVAFAINHATGFAGMNTVTVPGISHETSPDGGCAADVAAGGPMEIVDQGQTLSLSRCTWQSLGVPADITLYPPEIDVRVARRAEDEGVPVQARTHLVRTGGAATTRDDYIQVSTHWRVRRSVGASADGGQGTGSDGGQDAGVDAGPLYAGCRSSDGGWDSGSCPNAIHDTGDAGDSLEVFCSELPPTATGAQRVGCLTDDSLLTDVPPGVPALAGHIVQVTSSTTSTPFVEPFFINPGRSTATVDTARHILTADGKRQTVGNLLRANYYVHVVGAPMAPRDTNHDGIIQPNEQSVLGPPPVPDFASQAGDPLGMPNKAVALKAVYRAYEPDGTLRERFDRSREHEFRVLDLSTPGAPANPTVVAGQENGGTKPLSGATASAAETDLSYTFLTSLLEPEVDGRATTPIGEYTVRLGGDSFGLDCDVKISESAKTLTGTCDQDALMDVLTAGDLLYIELYLSGNAENVLYRFNFYGLAPRRDFLSASSAYTAEQSIKKDTAQGEGAVGRPISSKALAEFFLLPSEFASGTVQLCTALDSSGNACAATTLLNETALTLKPDGTYDLKLVTAASAGPYPEKLVEEPLPGLEGARRFRLPLPAHVTAMPGSSLQQSPKLVYLVAAAGGSAPVKVQPLGFASGKFSATHARAPGQKQVGGVDLSDGHLSFAHEDMAARQFATTVAFARIYDNQQKLPTPLGVSWTHNYDGYLQEERPVEMPGAGAATTARPGRYTVVLAGQTYAFPKCVGTPVGTDGKPWLCETDNAHGGQLKVTSGVGGGLSFLYWDARSGTWYRFDQPSATGTASSRRRWLLTSIDDGHAHPLGTTLSYLPGTDLLQKVQTEGALSLEFAYAPVDVADPHVPPRIRALASGKGGFGYLEQVSLKNGSTVLHQVKYSFDEGSLRSAQRGTGLPRQRWKYEYEPGASGQGELKVAELRLSDASGTDWDGLGAGEFVQWRASFGRSGAQESYGHVSPGTMVTSVVLPGQQGNAFKVDYQAASGSLPATRTVTSADGVPQVHTLNDYGNVTGEKLPLTSKATGWNSSTLGLAVTPKRQVAKSGLAHENAFDPHVRQTSATLKDLPDTGQGDRPVAGVAKGTVVAELTPHARYGGSTVTTMPGAGGGRITVETPVSAAGDVIGVTVKDESGATISTAQVTAFSADGVPLTETDELGRLIVYSSFNALGLPQDVTVTDPAPAPGALGVLTRHLDYDELGRLVGISEDQTGASTTWQLDSQGRRTSQTRAGTPPQTWTYAYLPGQKDDYAKVMADTSQLTKDSSLVIIEEKLAGTAHVRRQYFADGLLVGETFLYGPTDDTLAVRKHQYDAGRPISTVDERGVTHSYAYDADGRPTKTTASMSTPDGGTTSLAEVSYDALDSLGHPTSVTGSDGQKTAITYDFYGRPTRWDYGSGDVESVVLDLNGAVVSRTFGSATPAHVLTSTVDPDGRPLATDSQDVNGGVHEVRRYDALGRQTHVEDKETGLVETFEYKDVLGRLTKHVRSVRSRGQTLEDVETRTYADSPSGSVVTVLHTVSTGQGAPRTKTTTLTLDAMARVVKKEDTVDGQASPTEYQYDSRGNLRKTVEPPGPMVRENVFEYDAAGYPRKTTLSGQPAVTYTADASGRVLAQAGPHPDANWTYQYDILGRLTGKVLTPRPSSGALAAKWTVAYGPDAAASGGPLAAGQVRQADPMGFTTTATSNARGKLVRQEEADLSRNSVVNVRTTALDYDGPWPKAQAVAEGTSSTQTTRSFDDRGRVLVEQESWDGGTQSYTYRKETSWGSGAPRLVASVTETWSTSGAPVQVPQRASTVEVDSLGNTVKLDQGVSPTLTDEWLYDAAGLLTKQTPSGKPATVYQYDEGVLSLVTFGTEETRYRYFADGRLKEVAFPDNRKRTQTWNLRGLLETEGYGTALSSQRTSYEYDEGGFASGITQGYGSLLDAKRWGYSNGPMGEVLTVTLPGAVGTYRYGYDAARRLVSLTPPGTSTVPVETFDWDYLGRPVSRKRGPATWTTTWANGEGTTVNPEGDTEIRRYDGRGRVARVGYLPGASTAANSTLTGVSRDYAGDDQPLYVTETRKSGQVDATSYLYDDKGLLKTLTRGVDVLAYTYTTSRQMETVRSPSGAVVTYRYDLLDRLSKLLSSAGPEVQYEWEPGGERLSALSPVSGSGVFERRCYDGPGRLAELVHANAALADCQPSAGVLSSFEYQYDGRGNRVHETYLDAQMTLPEQTDYGYDDADRLVGMRLGGQGTTLYKLGGDGSRLGEAQLPATYSGTLNGTYDTIVAPGAPFVSRQWAYGYDSQGGLKTLDDVLAGARVTDFATNLAGRVVSEKRIGLYARAYGWDADGRLASIIMTPAGGTASASQYAYDFEGKRRTKSGPAGSASYVWGSSGIVEERPGSGSALVYGRGSDGQAATIGSEQALHDALGGVSGRDGAALTLYRVDAFGNPRTDLNNPGHWVQPPASGPSLAFAGMHCDPGTGLCNAEQRWYDPATGRFLSEDPVGPGGRLMTPTGLNPWGYAAGNPLKYTDPDGRCEKYGYSFRKCLAAAEQERAQAMALEAGRTHNAALRAEAAKLSHDAEYAMSEEDARQFKGKNVILPIPLAGAGLAVSPLLAMAAGTTAGAKALWVGGIALLGFSQTSGQPTAGAVYGPVVQGARCVQGGYNQADRVGDCISAGTVAVTFGIAGAPGAVKRVRDALSVGTEMGAAGAGGLPEAVGEMGGISARSPITALPPTAPPWAAAPVAAGGARLGVGDLYSAHTSGSAGVLADLDSGGMLNLYIKVGPGTPRGGQMFAEAMEAFGPNVKGIRGTWIGGGDIADNFNAFGRAVAAGSAPEEAAFQTFTGHMAETYGFKTARIVQNDAGKVVVEFTQ
ncbi:MAG: RHS repeat-associated core domain-containing protein [Myxococcaceae bacterium]